ncbi:MAG: hypothetical protein JXQ27_11490 [Acidobacteria bacterium]|nr:hypothetical protein [Acidobacteriota bacterium]
MFFHESHHEHKVLLARYLADELSPADKIRFFKKVARCRTCQRELQDFEEIRSAMSPGDTPVPASRVFAPAVETLRRLHLRDGFRERLLPEEPAAARAFNPSPALRLAGFALMMLLIVTVPLVLYYSGRPADVAPAAITVKTVESAPPDPGATASLPTVTPAQPALRPPSANPIPSDTEARGVVIDSATLVLLTNYLSGNINRNNFRYVDLNHNGMVDAVDLAVILNFSVDNVTLPQLNKLLQAHPPKPASPQTVI